MIHEIVWDNVVAYCSFNVTFSSSYSIVNKNELSAFTCLTLLMWETNITHVWTECCLKAAKVICQIFIIILSFCSQLQLIVRCNNNTSSQYPLILHETIWGTFWYTYHCSLWPLKVKTISNLCSYISLYVLLLYCMILITVSLVITINLP